MIPREYSNWIESFSHREISFGYGGLKLFAPEEIEEGQVGYSRSAEGASFCDGMPGSWKSEWIVIGFDTLVGDPIILDTSNSALPVMTAAQGEESWEPDLISASLSAFDAAIKTIRRLSAGRENPVELEQNPLTAGERDQALESIQAANGDDFDIEFWALMLESE
ncbi:MAG TPA: hypothetical protein VFP71_07120 [Candidatus Angelobacter sp.]|nr:hypothetical protein [Candidatus Angelobacter sp.]